jgi:hypothetical protein
MRAKTCVSFSLGCLFVGKGGMQGRLALGGLQGDEGAGRQRLYSGQVAAAGVGLGQAGGHAPTGFRSTGQHESSRLLQVVVVLPARHHTPRLLMAEDLPAASGDGGGLGWGEPWNECHCTIHIATLLLRHCRLHGSSKVRL